MVGVGFLAATPGHGSQAVGIYADGNFIDGRVSIGNDVFAMRWTQAQGLTSLGDLPGGSVGGMATAASADGSIVVGSSLTAAGQEAFIWDGGSGMRRLADVLTAGGAGAPLTGW